MDQGMTTKVAKGETMSGDDDKDGRKVDGAGRSAAEHHDHGDHDHHEWIEKMMARRAARIRRWHSKPKALRVVIVLALVALATTVVGLIVMGLWNALVPAVFAGPAITWAQALGLFVLGRVLFGGWGGRRHHGHGGGFRGRWQRKLDHLSPEAKERMRAMMARGRGGAHA